MKDHSDENSMVTGLQFEESSEMPEPEFIRESPRQIGMLSERIDLALLDYRNDKADIDILVMLLEECQIAIRQADHNFRSIVDTCTMIDNEIERLKNTSFGSKQS